MRTSELIAILQRLQAQHGDLPVRVLESEFGEYRNAPEIDVGLGYKSIDVPDGERFVAIGQASFAQIVECAIDRLLGEVQPGHWSWNPKWLENQHGDMLRAAGVTDIAAWMESVRPKAGP